MTIDVAIPSYRPDKKLKEILKRLNKQTLKPDRILIINTVKEWMDEDEYEEFNNLQIIHISEAEFDHGGTRDMAMRLLSADYVVFMTQDALPADMRLLEKLVMPMEEDREIAVSYARQLPAKDAGVIERYTRDFNYGEEDILMEGDDVDTVGIKAYFCSDVCAAYRKSCYDEIGGFPGKTIFNEDMIYAAKALSLSYKKYYAAGARVIHSHNYTAWQQFSRNFDLGVSHRQFPYIFDEKMKTENEGIRLVKDTAGYLINSGHWYLIPKLILHSGAKYLGYRLGKMYNRLPKDVVLRCSMNRNYWIYK